MAVHPYAQRAFCFSNIIFATLAAKHKADNVFSCASCFALILRARFYIQMYTVSLCIADRTEQFVICNGVFIVFS